ncbi:hypothetical protein RI129_003499 [Pyrocoelia pectoralis]|uniref:CN hydrolase domain-containing protein n=1 Tax=Pyrocoelia pectoralis TaxID=417401 RepID=A0AAN7ZN38_9COLE
MHLFYVLLGQIFLQFVYGHDTYRAAVVEYAPKLTASTPEARVMDNVHKYVEFIEEAATKKRVDIILFAENGLTGMDIDTEHIDDMSTEVPDPTLFLSPCSSPSNYSEALVVLSCTAQMHKLYVVVNLIERFVHNSSQKFYYNTNIVFDRRGVVISRFRKINLFFEDYITPGNDIATFKSDFGVTFGMFICNDILFKYPSLEILADNRITDILYSVAWFSEIPFLGALSVQHGYAITNGVNLLASGHARPSFYNGGSGIYLANGSVANVYISGTPISKMLIADVHKGHRRSSPGSCQSAVSLSNNHKDVTRDISGFNTIKENMVNYTFKSLDITQSEIFESLCSTKDSCCSINITSKRTNFDLNYVYKLAVFKGGRYIATDTIGSRSCGLIACLNHDNDSCGKRNSNRLSGIIFEKIVLKGTFQNIRDGQDRPATLNYNLEPIGDYTFCKKEINKDAVEIILSITKPQTDLLTFGIFGRDFNSDNKGTGVFE